MGEQTKIQWTWRRLDDGTMIAGRTFNPWWGCLKVSEECTHCYAEGFAKRVGRDIWGPVATTPRWLLSENNWKQPIKWNVEAEKQGHRQSVFCASMADVFEDHPLVVESRKRLWLLIQRTYWLNWLLLTKRPENILQMVPMSWLNKFPDNVWVGTSVGNQKRAEERIPILLKVPAVVRFLSCEPLLEEINIMPWIPQLQWIICGGESGPKHRAFHPEWARSLRDQCLSARLQGYPVQYFFKQHGGRTHDSGGRLLDGRTWDELPPEFPMVCTEQF